MNKPLYLFVGRSASGKTTIANMLENIGYKQVQSYTTRKPRYDGESGHIFVTKEEFENLGELAAYTFYNGNEYGTTFKQLDECSIYVVDVPGVESLLNKHRDKDKKICIVYFDASVNTRINRMIDRGDCDTAIVCRLTEDEKFDWLAKMYEITSQYDYITSNNFLIVNANMNISDVFNTVLNYMIDQEEQQ